MAESKPTAKKAAAKKSAAKPASKKPSPKPNLDERMEGVQGWMAEIEKKQERTSRFGGIAVLLAIAAAGGALALGIINKQDAATQDDIDELTEKVNALGASVERQTESQLKSINQRLATVEQQIASLNQRQRQTESQIENLETASAAAAAAPPPADTDTDVGKDTTEKP
jgi:cell division protein FtsB